MTTDMKKKKAPTKPKKITIKFFVNKAVQPTIEGETKRYPLYALITYDRKNTMMRCHYGNYYKDLNEIERVHYPGLLAMEERIIRKTIDYEWLDNSAIEDYKIKLKDYHFKNQPEVTKSIDFIERIVRTSLDYSNT